MTNYNDGKWHGWNGGECPVHPKTLVDAVLCTGAIRREEMASHVVWSGAEYLPSSHVIAFRVVKEHREPIEVWLIREHHGGLAQTGKGTPGARLFREVIE